MADDDHYFDDPAFADPNEPNPCGHVYFGTGYSSIFDCMKPKGHDGDHANPHGVNWAAEPDLSEEAWCEHYMPGAACRYCAPEPDREEDR